MTDVSARPLIAMSVVTSCVALLLVGCASVDNLRAAERSPPSLKALATQQHVCGVALAVIRNRKLASIDTASGCDGAFAPHAESIFQAASLGKPVFAYAVLKLVAEGKMQLDAPVVSYLPQGYWHRFVAYDPASQGERIADPRLGAVTVRMALSHTTGLPNWANGPLEFSSEPGGTWQYSGEGYAVLQSAVEAVTGDRIDHYMWSHVFQPLGMSHSSYIFDMNSEGQIINPVAPDGERIARFDFRIPAAAFSLSTSIEDYGKFLSAVLNDKAMLDQITQSSVVVDQHLGLDWGLGWGIERRSQGAAIWHWGNNTGYRSFAMASVDDGNGFVMLSNSENGLALAEPLANRVLSGTHRIFQVYMLRDGLGFLACKEFGICL